MSSAFGMAAAFLVSSPPGSLGLCRISFAGKRQIASRKAAAEEALVAKTAGTSSGSCREAAARANRHKITTR